MVLGAGIDAKKGFPGRTLRLRDRLRDRLGLNGGLGNCLGGTGGADAAWIVPHPALEKRRRNLVAKVTGDEGLVGHGGTGGKGISSRPKWMVECLSQPCQQISKTMM